jgi:prohibitin 1
VHASMSDGIYVGDDLIDLDADTGNGGGGWFGRALRLGQDNINRLMVFAGILLLIAIYFAPQIFITVQSGEVGVRYLRFAGGTQTDRVLGEGMKIVLPWDKLFIYNVRVQERKHAMDVLTNEGMTVTLDLSIRYHPEIELVGLLHQQVGPDYADKIVIPEVESALRTAMGGISMRQVYGSERALLQTILNDALEHVAQKFIRVDGIVLRKVTLPQKVTIAVEDKIVQKELVESYEFRLDLANKEAERQRIEANGLKVYHDILSTSLNENILRWQGIEATKELAKSPNAKTVIVGDKNGLPLILGEK